MIVPDTLDGLGWWTMRIDLNADLGESYGAWTMGDDPALLEVVSSAGVACGFHAGDPATMRRTVAAAVDRGISVGAHVSYPDLVGFGRRFIDMDPAELSAAVIYQLGALQAMCRVVGARLRYLKPHGALYNTIVHHEAQAAAVVEAVIDSDPTLPILGLPGSAVLSIADQQGLQTVTEAFADRAYTSLATLVPRGELDAVLHDPEVIAKRMLRLVREGLVTAVDGTDVAVSAQSICVHGDSPGAVAIAQQLRAALTDTGIAIEPFG